MDFSFKRFGFFPGSIAPAYSSLVGCDTHVQRLQLLELAELAQADPIFECEEKLLCKW